MNLLSRHLASRGASRTTRSGQRGGRRLRQLNLLGEPLGKAKTMRACGEKPNKEPRGHHARTQDRYQPPVDRVSGLDRRGHLVDGTERNFFWEPRASEQKETRPLPLAVLLLGVGRSNRAVVRRGPAAVAPSLQAGVAGGSDDCLRAGYDDDKILIQPIAGSVVRSIFPIMSGIVSQTSKLFGGERGSRERRNHAQIFFFDMIRISGSTSSLGSLTDIPLCNSRLRLELARVRRIVWCCQVT